jgi:predicted nucleic acid-binding protein
MKDGASRVRFVLDASVAVSWCFHDEQDARADASFTLLEDEAAALVPLLWWFEVRNAAILGIRRGRITEAETATFFARLEKLMIEFAPLPDAGAVFALARRHHLTFYDASYLELAMRERIALATLDQALARAAVTEGVPLIGAT